MIGTTLVCAPAGVSGPGGLVVRPAAGSGLRPVAVRLRTLALPTPVDVPVRAVAPTGAGIDGTAVPTAPQFGTAREQFQNDGTTLGIQPPGRPQS